MGGISISLQSAMRAALYALLFIASVQIMLELARAGENVTAIWVASGVLAWALIASPTRDWPIILTFAAIAHILRAVVFGERPAAELVYLIANLGGPFVCAGLLRWRGTDLAFQDRSSVLNFLLIAGVLAPAFTAATAAVGVLVDPRRFELEDLGVWFLADTLSYIVFLPVIMSVMRGGWRDLLRSPVRVRAAVLFAILIAALAYQWFMPIDLRRAFPMVLIPFLIFIVFELGLAGARAALAITTVALLLYALFSPEAARPGMSHTGYIVSVQIYLATLVACILPLAAALAEKQKLYESASEALEEAQSAWSGLIAAEAHYRLIADNTRDLVMRIDLDRAILFASPACHLISVNVNDLEGRQIEDLAHPDDAEHVRSEMIAFIRENLIDRPRTIRARFRDASNGWCSFDMVSTLVASNQGKVDEVIAVLREVSA